MWMLFYCKLRMGNELSMHEWTLNFSWRSWCCHPPCAAIISFNLVEKRPSLWTPLTCFSNIWMSDRAGPVLHIGSRVTTFLTQTPWFAWWRSTTWSPSLRIFAFHGPPSPAQWLTSDGVYMLNLSVTNNTNISGECSITISLAFT